MRNDLSDITVIMDRSGSMASCKDEAETGMNHFIAEQQKLPGEAMFSLVQFDTTYEFVHKAVPIRDVPKCTLEPRGMTALLDAIGRAINETGERLKNTHEDQRPGLVVFLIVTDGQENASHEFRREQIRKMIQHQQDAYKWQFTFLGANQDAFAEAAAMGIDAAAAANFSTHKTAQAYGAASNMVRTMRFGISSGEGARCVYTAEDRSAMS